MIIQEVSGRSVLHFEPVHLVFILSEYKKSSYTFAMAARTLTDVFVFNWNELKAKCSHHHARVQAKIEEICGDLIVKEENLSEMDDFRKKYKHNFDKIKIYHEMISSVMKEDMSLFESEMLKKLQQQKNNDNKKFSGAMINLCDDEFSFTSIYTQCTTKTTMIC